MSAYNYGKIIANHIRVGLASQQPAPAGGSGGKGGGALSPDMFDGHYGNNFCLSNGGWTVVVDPIKNKLIHEWYKANEKNPVVYVDYIATYTCEMVDESANRSPDPSNPSAPRKPLQGSILLSISPEGSGAKTHFTAQLYPAGNMTWGFSYVGSNKPDDISINVYQVHEIGQTDTDANPVKSVSKRMSNGEEAPNTLEGAITNVIGTIKWPGNTEGAAGKK